ncbi:hypothetical protein AMATHDRAFT_5888 [Amanita thiersii Skay4041]|uniref:Uncharacterized protein n=1 Tax=Amanita thiersii Skay4041 TaxID=703135 RepID=A0A2A9NBF6_9AGAR|nr:hypothetical protein AMATHDRAFT_5888 [Amanita thiersii Skay4041]
MSQGCSDSAFFRFELAQSASPLPSSRRALNPSGFPERTFRGSIHSTTRFFPLVAA